MTQTARELNMPRALKAISPLFWLAVIVPTLLATLYFGLLAGDVYVSEARIVVRNPSQPAASPLTAALNQTGFGSAQEGNNTVIEFIQSRQAITETNKDGLLTKAYANPSLSFLDRFGGLGGESQEHFYRYFGKKVTVEEGATTQILTITVRAFDPEQAQEINKRLVERSELLINSLSERGQRDFIKVAEEEVEEAAQEARSAALALANFRGRNQIVDPEEQAKIGLQMISKLQDELIASQTRLRQLQSVTPRAPQIPFLKTQIRALKEEIREAKGELVGGNASLSTTMAKYQELRLASELAEKQLAVVLASREEAKAEARRKQAYVEQVAQPSLPDYPTEPRRWRGILATFVLGLLAWGVLTMLMIGVREHKE